MRGAPLDAGAGLTGRHGRPAAVTQADVVRNLTRAGEAGASRFLVALRWMEAWEACLVQGGTGDDVGPIANDTLLVAAGGELRPGLAEGLDYAVVSGEVWGKLVEWYGGGPCIARPMVEVGYASRKRLLLEVYPMLVCVAERRNPTATSVRVPVSRADPGIALLRRACLLRYMAPHRARLWHLVPGEGFELLPLHESLQHSSVDETTELVLEEQLPSDQYEPLPPPWTRPKVTPASLSGWHMAVSRGGGQWSAAPAVVAQDSVEPSPCRGVTGLSNLGNTCFMNSSVQCIAAVPAMRALLTNEDKWKGRINKSNPLGSQGRIVAAMAKLLARMWAADNVTHLVPREVKKVVSDWAPQFEGYRQHDAQEFVSFLLDGIHEDLNQSSKAARPQGDVGASASEEDLANAVWTSHLQRNQSDIVRTFHGLLRSSLKCPKCGHASVSFDVSSVLSVPLPRSATRSILIHFVAIGQLSAKQVQVSVLRTGTVGDVKMAIKQATGILMSCELVLGEVYQRVLYREYANDEADLSIFNPGDQIFAFEVADAPCSSQVALVQCCIRTGLSEGGPLNLVGGWPLLVTVNLPPADGARSVVGALSRLLTRSNVSDATKLKVTARSGKSCGASCGQDDCKGCEMSDEVISSILSKADNKSGGNASSLKRLFLVVDEKGPISFPGDVVKMDGAALPSTKCLDESQITLDACLRSFVEPEILGNDDAWLCPNCKLRVGAEKQISLWKLPRVLVVHLKRFAQVSARHREKLDTLVRFPIEGLDLSGIVAAPKVDPASCVYDLVAVSNHMGGLGGGHYVAHTRNMESGEWWEFNDEFCTRVIDIQTLVSRSAYLLFYQARIHSDL